MNHEQPDKTVNNVVALKPADAPESASVNDWSALLAALGEKQDKQLFVSLFGHFAPRVKAYILRLGLVESVAEELMQETMLLMWRKAHMYKPERAAASTWIFTLARNQSIDWMRKQKYPEYSFDETFDQIDESSEGAGEQLVVSGHLGAIIETLPENQAQVIYMSFYEGRAHGEIAERLGIPLGSVKSRIRLACEKIKAAWRDV